MEMIDYAKKTWNMAIEYLLSNQKITQTSYENWLKEVTPLSMDSQTIIIATRDEFVLQWLSDKYTNIIENAIEEVIGEKLNVQFVLENTEPQIEEPSFVTNQNHIQNDFSEVDNINTAYSQTPQQQFTSQVAPNYELSNLNEFYTFDNFIVGDGNQFSYNISLSVAQNPGKKYNPLFLYGGSGLGKTHLMQAIGHYILQQNPNTKITYVTCETFLNDFINNIIREKNNNEFRRKYRDVDVLLVDDIQFLAGKEKIQEEFFHTFNHLYSLNKQIVITSDAPPTELSKLTERLISRFSWGIITDMQPLDIETRIAILNKKVEMLNSDEYFPSDVIEYVASQFELNVRELEGGLNRVLAYASIYGARDINLDLAVEALKGFSKKSSEKMSILRIQKIVAKYFQISVEDLQSKTRKQPLTTYRQIAIYLCKELTDNSLQKIGQNFGKRDHTTIMHAVDKIEELRKKDKEIDALIHELKNQL
ncbi:chromosomal replication initiator protein DnaA [Culicoidibacter larvae]|nr:chromosomal replication initiator protein DnaA [Culicoidibacter larvae]